MLTKQQRIALVIENGKYLLYNSYDYCAVLSAQQKGRRSMKNRKLLLIVSLVLALTMAMGSTLAYLTDTDEAVNVMTLGKVKIDQLEYERVDDESKDDDATVQEFHDNKPLLPAVTDKDFTYTPGDTYVDWDQIGKEEYTSPIWDPSKINNEVDKMVFIKNKGDYDAFVLPGFNFTAIGDIAMNNPDKYFLVVDSTITDSQGNKYYVYEDYELYTLTPGAVDLLDTKFDAEVGTITFETDRFSDYAIAYSDIEPPPATGDSFSTVLWVTLMAVSAMALAVLLIGKKKEIF